MGRIHPRWREKEPKERQRPRMMLTSKVRQPCFWASFSPGVRTAEDTVNNAAGEACSTALAVTPRRKLVLGDLSNAIKDDEEIGKTNRGIRWVVGESFSSFISQTGLMGKLCCHVHSLICGFFIYFCNKSVLSTLTCRYCS